MSGIEVRFGSKIQLERKRRGWTQKDLAIKSGLLQPAIARYEKGGVVSPKNLRKMTDAFGVSIEDFTKDLAQDATSSSMQDPIPTNSYLDEELHSLIREIKSFTPSKKVVLLEFLRALSKANKVESALSN